MVASTRVVAAKILVTLFIIKGGETRVLVSRLEFEKIKQDPVANEQATWAFPDAHAPSELPSSGPTH
jgi:hypothetical protein